MFDLDCFAGLMVGSDHAALLSFLLLRIGSVRIPDTIVCLGASVWLFSPAWDAVELTLEVGGIYPFVVIDPTDQGATTVVAPGLMIDDFLSSYNHSCSRTNDRRFSIHPRRSIPAFIPFGIKASLSVSLPYFSCWAIGWCQCLV